MVEASNGTVASSSPSPLQFLHLLEVLKNTPRTGWVRRGVKNAESISDHMYRMSILCMMIKGDGVDKNRCIKMALVHDMGEAIIGDITPADNVPKAEKARLELEAVRKMAAMIQPVNAEFAAEVVDLFQEFEDGETEEAKILHDIDYFECLCQRNEYESREKGARDLDEFETLVPKIKTDEIKAWTRQLVTERAAYLAKPGI